MKKRESRSRSRGGSGRQAAAVLAGIVVTVALPARAMTINATFDSTLSSNAAAVSEINSAVSFYDATFTNNITVNINFSNMTSGLGQSSQSVFGVGYSAFTGYLTSSATTSGDTYLTTATQHFGAGNVPSSGTVWATSADLAALGHGVGTAGGSISINSGAIDFTGHPSGSQYDGLQVIEHEINEILGIGGGGSMLGSGLNGIGALDLYRYSAPGTPSFSTLASGAYFSINGGVTNLANFNQTAGGDYGDWNSANCTFLHVQNASGCPGTTVSMLNGPLSPEWIALQSIGYTVQAVPEPSTWAMLLVGLSGVAWLAHRRPSTLRGVVAAA